MRFKIIDKNEYIYSAEIIEDSPSEFMETVNFNVWEGNILELNFKYDISSSVCVGKIVYLHNVANDNFKL